MLYTIVVTKLEFRVRPPAVVNVYVSQTVVIDCAASGAPGVPLAYTEWTKLPPPLCEEAPRQLNVSRNGSLVVSIKLEDEGLYRCKALTRYEAITTMVYLNVSPCKVNAVVRNCYIGHLFVALYSCTN